MNRSLVPFLFQSLLSFIFLPGLLRAPQKSEEVITIDLARPGEGETFYAGPSSLLYNIPIHGWVESELYPYEEIKVALAIYQASELVSNQETYLNSDGTYEFYATVNPEGSTENFPATQADCSSYCHYLSEIVLPAGDMTIALTAIDPDGNQDNLERHITVDRSDYAYIPLQIVLADSDSSDYALKNIPVTAATRVYMWRSRHSVASTDADGQVEVRVEALSESPTHYWLQVEPSVVDGVLYYSEEPVEVTLPPGAESAPSLVLSVSTETGSIKGEVVGVDETLLPSARVLAIRLNDGFFYSTNISRQGDFVFDPIPLGEYRIVPDLVGQSYRQEFIPQVETVDLIENPAVSIEFAKTEVDSHGVQGDIRGEDNQRLPFAWVTSEELPLSQQVLANSGEFEIQGLPKKTITFIVNAPGYYSRAYNLASSPEQWQSLSPVLTRRPETVSIPWGTGEIVVPPESSVEVDGSHIKFERGWLWGHNSQEVEIAIHHESADIVMMHGRFAFENLPNRNNWLYLMEGSAIVYPTNGMPSVTVNAGEMITLIKNKMPIPIPMDQVVITTLDTDTNGSVQPVWEPTLSARIRDSLATVGVNSAQFITFITYGLILTSIVGFPFLALYFRYKMAKPNH